MSHNRSEPEPNASDTAPPDERTATPERPPGWVTALWMGHGLLRAGLFVYLLVYGWSKLFLMQMGQADFAGALVTMGEKSPMGLLWEFIAYAPAVQFLSGLVEVTAAVLLIWRRTAWLGGLLGAAALGVVYLLNLAYHVPVKGLALALTLGCVLVALPELRRLGAFLAGRAVGAFTPPRPVPWPRVHAVTRWVFASLGVLIAVSPVAAAPMFWAEEVDSELPGVYRVVEDTAAPADQLADDERWQAIAFGRYGDRERGQGRYVIRTADGGLIEGRYSDKGDDRLLLRVSEDPPVSESSQETVELAWSLDDGRLTLEGDGHDLVAETDPDLRYLYDQGFSWFSGEPDNR
ncbi:hypothetical protein [Nocardiopsis coralli]|uniref:hypothetical protein n=1 Tax=Nocardiopsis coralli TaxID=2772213 RepID=UPI001F3EA8E5|nr:hypothetical protein [Nocardiopsis coralli]